MSDEDHDGAGGDVSDLGEIETAARVDAVGSLTALAEALRRNDRALEARLRYEAHQLLSYLDLVREARRMLRVAQAPTPEERLAVMLAPDGDVPSADIVAGHSADAALAAAERPPEER